VAVDLDRARPRPERWADLANHTVLDDDVGEAVEAALLVEHVYPAEGDRLWCTASHLHRYGA
jgi:DNA polymerase II small subunit/DNA polymerase delta subunit B